MGYQNYYKRNRERRQEKELLKRIEETENIIECNGDIITSCLFDEEENIAPFAGFPSSFCPWAWDDIYKSLVGFATGGNYGMWYENKNIRMV